jgi:hypothetical protein
VSQLVLTGSSIDHHAHAVRMRDGDDDHEERGLNEEPLDTHLERLWTLAGRPRLDK